MTRWLVLPLGLAAAAVTVWLLLGSGEPGSRRPTGRTGDVAAPTPHAEIDAESRAMLRAILEEPEAGREGR